MHVMQLLVMVEGAPHVIDEHRFSATSDASRHGLAKAFHVIAVF